MVAQIFAGALGGAVEVTEFGSRDLDYYDWTFGQVIAMLLLAGPLVTIVESFCSDAGRGKYYSAGDETHGLSAPEVTTAQTMLPASGRSSPILAPSRNSHHLGHATWRSYCSILRMSLVYCMLMSLPILGLLLPCAIGVRSFTGAFVVLGAGRSCYFFLFAPLIGLWELILFSLAFDDLLKGQKRWIRVTLWLLNIFLCPSICLVWLFYFYLIGAEDTSLAWLGVPQAALFVAYGLVRIPGSVLPITRVFASTV
ncbi:hypothetical protein An04g06760 [Aspergillus niger]|uniref:Uncharacterized protein n=2 Tax=Aspergillus niger TaxID=5061 RepID=A2QJE4_ASPNC|nr:hypothetical protein An04g06760 [Aspergillus niger]CAK44679.1 hypothetical protein An04g06760 [Aspergillus niger]